MWSAETVFVCALGLLGRSQASFPAVELIGKAPAGVSPLAQGYALPAEGRIVLITSTDAFVRARQARDRCNNIEALREIAGVLAHEEWHLQHGSDEQGAYETQLVALLATGADINGPLFHKIQRARRAVVASKRSKTGVLARSGD